MRTKKIGWRALAMVGALWAVGCGGDGGDTDPNATGGLTAGTNGANAGAATQGTNGDAGATGGDGAATSSDGGGNTGEGGTTSGDGGTTSGDGGTGDGGMDGAVDDETSPECPVVVKEADCDESKRPIVFIHGTYGAGDNGEHLAMLFGSNGYCQKRFVALDYNSLPVGQPDPHPVYAIIDETIDAVLEETGFDKVDLMGHSQGGRHGYAYISDTERAERVENYIHLAGSEETGEPNGVRILSLASEADSTGLEGVSGATESVLFEELDHMGVAMASEAFVEMWKFLYGEEPQYDEVQCGGRDITLEGKMVTFGDNAIPEGYTMRMYEMGDTPREFGEMIYETTIGADGKFGPIAAKRGVMYETEAIDGDGIVGHMYSSPWKRDDRMMRGVVPSANPVTAVVTALPPRNDDHVALVVRYNRSALRADLGHTLTIDGHEVLSEEIASAETTTVGLFLVDDNENQESDLGTLPIQGLIPFVQGSDVYMQAEVPSFMKVKYNDEELLVPNWPSETNDLTVVMFQ